MKRVEKIKSHSLVWCLLAVLPKIHWIGGLMQFQERLKGLLSIDEAIFADGPINVMLIFCVSAIVPANDEAA